MSKYTKILIAQKSIKNNCNADDGTYLYLKPINNSTMKGSIQHHFLSCNDNKIKSKYGWVKEEPPFTLEEFLDRYLSKNVSDDIKTSVELMLNSINKLSVDTPVTATYRKRGIGASAKMVLTVHKVIFYKQ